MFRRFAFLCALVAAASAASVQVEAGGSLSAPSGSGSASSALNAGMNLGSGIAGSMRQMVSGGIQAGADMMRMGVDAISNIRAEMVNAASQARAQLITNLQNMRITVSDQMMKIIDGAINRGMSIGASIVAQAGAITNIRAEVSKAALEARNQMIAELRSMRVDVSDQMMRVMESALEAGISIGSNVAAQGIVKASAAAQANPNSWRPAASGQVSLNGAGSGMSSAINAGMSAGTGALSSAINTGMSGAGAMSSAVNAAMPSGGLRGSFSAGLGSLTAGMTSRFSG